MGWYDLYQPIFSEESMYLNKPSQTTPAVLMAGR